MPTKASKDKQTQASAWKNSQCKQTQATAKKRKQKRLKKQAEASRRNQMQAKLNKLQKKNKQNQAYARNSKRFQTKASKRNCVHTSVCLFDLETQVLLDLQFSVKNH